MQEEQSAMLYLTQEELHRDNVTEPPPDDEAEGEAVEGGKRQRL